MNRLVVELEWVFSRHSGADVQAAYEVLVPQRRARTRRVEQQEQMPEGVGGDHGGDLCEGVLAAVQQISDLFGVPRSAVYGRLNRATTVPRQPKKTAVSR
ncbi:hypothetical protein [Streptomyces sp. CdTB01]|uniref:hypothetical protein n=1 Tax=Streptomyces sp. CdTB01 TaxID=1725411 RepID=UPI00073A92C6|nr:hypothetical protein [Streptomyces sp. CdTB01]ALV39223.1 hypothetical protein AS200_44820 [Streptomyces sp. CdTB01]